MEMTKYRTLIDRLNELEGWHNSLVNLRKVCVNKATIEDYNAILKQHIVFISSICQDVLECLPEALKEEFTKLDKEDGDL